MSAVKYLLLNAILLFSCVKEQSAYSTDLEDLSYRFKLLALDITRQCRENTKTYVFLPYGSGITDARIMTISIPNYNINGCPIDISLLTYHNETILGYSGILVFEFIFNDDFSSVCSKPDTLIEIIFYSKRRLNVCKDVEGQKQLPQKKDDHKRNKRYMKFVEIFRNTVRIYISMNMTNFSGTIKITATSARDSGLHNTCNKRHEIMCKIGKEFFCINKFLKCDGNANCGFYENFDEEKRDCKPKHSNMFWKIAIHVVFMLFLLCFIVYHVLRVNVPSVANDFFIFDEDEENNRLILVSQSLPPADSDSESHLSSGKESERDLAIINKINRRSSNYISIPASEKVSYAFARRM